jgi:hypothetical protein
MVRKSGSKKKKSQPKPSSPPPRTGHILVSDGAGTVVVAGGYSDKSTGLMDVWSYRDSSGWECLYDSALPSRSSSSSAAAASPLSRSMAAGCLAGGCVYLFGGMQQEGSQMLVYNDLWQFNLASRQW